MARPDAPERPGLFSPAPRTFAAAAGAVPACSVVMTSYRDTRFLRAAVDSVLAQDFTQFELIVVDDGSPDPGPVAALPALDPRIRVLRLEENRGTAEAANRGIALARAPLIARLDSDDLAEPQWLSAAIGVLYDDPELGLVGSAATLIDEGGHIVGALAMPDSDFAIRYTLLFHSPFSHSSTVYRRGLFDLAGGYRADQPVSQDHYLWAEMLPLCRARNLPEPLVRYRINPNGLIATNSIGNPAGRTAPIREAAWREIGLVNPLANLRLHDDASTLLRGRPLADLDRHRAAGQVLEQALDRVVELGPGFIKAGEDGSTHDFVAELRRRIASGPARPNGLVERGLAVVRQRGLRGALVAVQQRAKAQFPALHRRADPAEADPVMAALHPVSPYAGFDARQHPFDPQGWESHDPVFRTLIAELRPKLIVEVGSWKGASAIHMASLAVEFGLDTRIVCVDTWLGSSEHLLGRRPEWRTALRPRHGYPQLYYTFLGNVVRTGHSSRIVPLPATSDAAAIVLADKDLRPELIYIDAAHEEGAVHRDLAAYWPLLAPGGTLIGDDYSSFPGVRAAAVRFSQELGLTPEDWGEKFILRKAADD